MTSTLRRSALVARQSSWLLAGTVLARVAGLLSMIVVLDVVGFEGLGRMTKVIAYVSLINGLADFRTVEAIVQHFQQAVDEGDGGRARAILRFCLRLDVSTGMLAAVLAIILAIPLTRLLPAYSDPELVGLVAIFSLSLLVSTANVAATTTLRVFERFAFVGLEEGFGGVFRRVLVIVAALWFRSVPAILWAYVIGAAIQSLVLISAALRTVNARVEPSDTVALEPAERSGLIRFMIGTNVLSSVAKLGEQADVLIVAFVSPDVVTGVYRLAVAARELVVAPLIALNRVAYPRIARAVSTGVDELRSEIRSLRSLGVVVGLGVGLITAIAADVLFSDVLSRGRDYGEAARILRLMLVGTAASAVYFWPGFVLLAHRRTRELTGLLAATTVISIVLSVAITPRFGLAGAASVYAATMVLRGLGQRRLCDRLGLL